MKKKNFNKENRLLLHTPVYIGVCLVLVFLLVLSLFAAVTIGSVNISVKDVYGVIACRFLGLSGFSGYASGSIHDVVWLIRLPRLFSAIVIGAGLAVCGIVIQAIVKNPLADPYILGISSGASLGATLAIMLGVGTVLGGNYVGITAFMGAFAVSLLVMTIANVGGRANSVKLLLAGMAISSACSAFSSFTVYFSNDKEGIQNITYWLMGSLAGAKWPAIKVMYFVIIGGILFFMTQYRTLNMMLLGDEVSVTLGTDLHKFRRLYLLITSVMIGFIVYSSGMIGFIGLLIPHFVRMFFGTDHKKIIPVSALTGSVFLIWADVISRILVPKTELPIGIVISMIGAPCFIYLLVKKTYGFGGNG